MAKDWSNIPLIFKQDVVKYLDFKDKCSLRKVSRAERDLVKTVPFHLMDLEFINGDGPEIELICQEHPVISNGIVSTKQYRSKNDITVNQFLAIFEHPKSIVDSVFLSFLNDNRETKKIVLELYEKLQKRPETFKIKTKSLTWHCQDTSENFLNILDRFDPKTLKGLHLDCPMTLEQLQRVVKTDVVQHLESFSLGSSCPDGFPPMELLFVNYIAIAIREITPEDTWSVIKNFRSTPRPYGSCFSFYNYQPNFKLIEIEEVVKMFDEPPNNLADFHNQRARHIQIFKMESGSGFLKVEITGQRICGTVTEKKD